MKIYKKIKKGLKWRKKDQKKTRKKTGESTDRDPGKPRQLSSSIYGVLMDLDCNPFPLAAIHYLISSLGHLQIDREIKKGDMKRKLREMEREYVKLDEGRDERKMSQK